MALGGLIKRSTPRPEGGKPGGGRDIGKKPRDDVRIIKKIGSSFP